jgi:hypothetical protein
VSSQLQDDLSWIQNPGVALKWLQGENSRLLGELS